MIVSPTRLALLPTMIAGALALSACGERLSTAQQTASPEGAFESALHGIYIDLSQSEHDEADYTDSDAFANRAIALSGGETVAPEEIGARLLPAEAATELTDARARLVEALDAGAAGTAPDSAASAQGMFDCWMQEQEENHQPGDISRCREGFLAAMDEVDVAMTPPPPPPPPPDVRQRFYMIFFDLGSSTLTDAALGTIGDILGTWRSGSENISLVGHTDSSGSEEFNMRLSQERADTVSGVLQEGGIDGDRLSAVGVGESSLIVPTSDNQREPRNRRVAVTVE